MGIKGEKMKAKCKQNIFLGNNRKFPKSWEVDSQSGTGGFQNAKLTEPEKNYSTSYYH
jgi:hypothetical protein